VSARWVPIGPPSALRFDPGACVTAGGRELAVFPLPGGWCALDNACPHQGGPLAAGQRDGETIECTWHGWRFDLRTGAGLTVRGCSVRSYPVREVGGVLEVGLEAGGG
jgi:nitrite reductase/ring-hydroxylating ferredoxin subunit